MTREELTKHCWIDDRGDHQMPLDEVMSILEEREREVLPFLKAYKQTLDCDWSLNPVQATNAVYRSPEAVLRDEANAIEAKREMSRKLNELIEKIDPTK